MLILSNVALSSVDYNLFVENNPLVVFTHTIYEWGSKAGIAVLDQTVFSGSNFLLNVLLARWLLPEHYGAFSLSFTVYLFFSGFHNALILEPMSVLGTAKYSHGLKKYLAGQFIIHGVVTGSIGLLMLSTGLILLVFRLVEHVLALFLIGMGLCLPLMLLMWLARRSCYVLGRPSLALISSTVYSFVLIFGAVFLKNPDRSAGPIEWYLLLGVASLAGSLLIFANPTMVRFGASNWLSLFREQWSFGKWIVLAAFLNFAGTQIQIFVVASRLGLDQAGAFRALQNFMLPMMQIIAAVSIMMIPSISFEFGKQNFRLMNSKAKKVVVALVAISFVYLIALFIFSRPAEQVLYDGKFSEFTPLIPLLGLVPLITAMEIGFSLVVRSLQRPLYHAISTGAMALASIIFSIFFVDIWGVQGAVVSLILVALTSLAVNGWFYQKWFIPKLAAEPAKQ